MYAMYVYFNWFSGTICEKVWHLSYYPLSSFSTPQLRQRPIFIFHKNQKEKRLKILSKTTGQIWK